MVNQYNLTVADTSVSNFTSRTERNHTDDVTTQFLEYIQYRPGVRCNLSATVYDDFTSEPVTIRMVDNSAHGDNSNHSNSPDPISPLGLVVTLLLSILIAGIIAGNTLVIVSVACFSKMRTLSNGLIASLASADLLVAIVVLPISLQRELTEDWTLGEHVCDLWITSDVFCCTASILNIVVIAVDRFVLLWIIVNSNY